jgi:hypothetical protein
MANKPFMMAESEKAPEVAALVQPNSVIRGLKKTGGNDHVTVEYSLF